MAHIFLGGDKTCSHIYPSGTPCERTYLQHIEDERGNFADPHPSDPIDAGNALYIGTETVVYQQHEWNGEIRTLVAGMECPFPSNCVNCLVVEATAPEPWPDQRNVPEMPEVDRRPRKMLIALPHNNFRLFGVRMDWSYRQRDLVFYAWLGERIWSKSLRDILAPPSPPPAGGFRNNLPEAFAALDASGNVTVIGYQGEWYFTRKPSWRVRLHNWLVRRG